MVLSMDRWKGKVAVVTGASSGIGACIAEYLVNAGLVVVGIARRPEEIEALSAKLNGKCGKLYALKCDITKEEEILVCFTWIQKNLGPIHVLVNNAGIAIEKNLLDGETHQWQKLFNTNVLGLCIATREAVKDMRANNVDGHIININSRSGHYVPNLPNINVYPASKHAVTALTETFRQELNSINSKIKITSISPAAVQTGIIPTVNHALVEHFKTTPFLQPEDVADAVGYILATPPHVQVHELQIRPVGDKV